VARTLTINNLTKKFGRITAVNNLSLSIEQGQIFGILGPNGSGKTTTLGMILDVVAPPLQQWQSHHWVQKRRQPVLG